MKILVAFAATILVMAQPVMAQGTARKLVCPSQVDYCYHVEKPILPQARTEDREKAAHEYLVCVTRAIDAAQAVWGRPLDTEHCNRYILPTR